MIGDGAVFLVMLLTILGCGIVAGVFFAFSDFVMKALGGLPAADGIRAMQSINVAVITPLFMTLLFGTGLGCLALGFHAVRSWETAGAPYLFAGAVSYVVGTVLVTIAFNVPRNEALEAVDPASSNGASLWADYLRSWTAWNHVRTIAAAAATVLLTLGLVV